MEPAEQIATVPEAMRIAIEHHRAGRLKEAEAIYRKVLDVEPTHADALHLLGLILYRAGKDAAAVRLLEIARRYLPSDPDLLANLGEIYRRLNRLEDSEQCCRRALELRPDHAGTHSNLILTIDLQDHRSIAEQQQERHRWYEQHGRRYVELIQPHENSPDPERRLRLGYVSADFVGHSAYVVFSPVIRRHDTAAFEVVCYSGVEREDQNTDRLRRAVHLWRSTRDMTDEELARQIRRDGIDILVDLSGHSSGNRLLVFARKPAPVQVTAWGYATGTGIPEIDYFLADPVLVPVADRALFAEELVDLPCSICYEAPDHAPEVSSLPALDGRLFTFGCLNRIEKISDRALALWSRVLSRVPEARLLIKTRRLDDAEARDHLLGRLEKQGIVRRRAMPRDSAKLSAKLHSLWERHLAFGTPRNEVVLLGGSSHEEHLRTFHEVDLALDPFPHGGGVSSAEAMWMGVPVVTLSGSTIPGRLGASMLAATGMQDWIARSEDDYVRIAVEAARDLPRLARMRSELRRRIAESAFGDPERYAQSVEAAYRSMWRRWCLRPARGKA